MLSARIRNFLLSRGKTIVSRNRKNALVHRLAHYNSTLRQWHENSDGDFSSNGEHFVLRSLGGCGFKTIFDVGANVGDWTLMARRIFPEATIHAFEIVEQTYEALRRSTEGLPNIVLNDFGLSDREGTVELNFFPNSDALATLTDYPHGHESVRINGRVRRGDTYVDDREIGHIDFIKLDVEGMESHVLKGLGETIEPGKVSVVQFEYGQMSIQTRFLLLDFYEFFVSRGYRLGKIYPNYVEFRDYRFEYEDFILSNYLAVSNERPELIRLLA